MRYIKNIDSFHIIPGVNIGDGRLNDVDCGHFSDIRWRSDDEICRRIFYIYYLYRYYGVVIVFTRLRCFVLYLARWDMHGVRACDGGRVSHRLNQCQGHGPLPDSTTVNPVLQQ